MTPARYIFVTDQGRVFYSETEPTPEDYEFAAVGMVVIVRLLDCAYFGREKEWQSPGKGRMGCVDLSEETTPSDTAAESAIETFLEEEGGKPPARSGNVFRPRFDAARILPMLGNGASRRLERSRDP